MSPQEKVLAAIDGGDLEALRAALAADPAAAAARDAQGVSAMLKARYRNQMDLVQALLAAGTELDLFAAAALGRCERLRALLDRSPGSVNSFAGDGFYPLGLACFFGQTEAVRLLLERGADVEQVAGNPMQVRPIHAAAASRDSEVLGLVLAAGADPNSAQQEGWTALHEAARHGSLERVRLLLARGADPLRANEAGKTPIALAEEMGHTEVLNLLQGEAR